ncbi:MAG: c-type cytochrome [Acidobacteriota bacterium]|nr:c-type cytochrome [Acidobacteriota bacterium]
MQRTNPTPTRVLLVALTSLALVPTLASAELRSSAADGFLVEHTFEIPAPPDAAWRALTQPESYWPADHTWSGSAENLSLDAKAGGCFCELWDGGSAEHGRVLMAQPGKLLRIRGSLGPLQEMAVAGVLGIALEETETGTTAVVTYRVSGDSTHDLTGIAPVVDEVIGQQLGGFAALAASGGSGPSSVLGGVYTELQAARGFRAYRGVCQECHKSDLGGEDMAPGLVGVAFSFRWRNKTLADIFTSLKTTMPLERAGSLTDQAYVDLVAFLLSKNDYPTGDDELAPDEALLAGIKVESQP